MTDDQLNDLAAKVADSIFKRLVEKQREWDEQFNEQMTEVSWDQVHEEFEKDASKSNEEKIEELKKLLAKAVDEEDYITASKINSKIDKLKRFWH
jgi:polyhydroxyalkanoate synthesis regulator phasin